MGQANNQQVIILKWPASDYYVICDRYALTKQGCKGFVLGKIPAISMFFLICYYSTYISLSNSTPLWSRSLQIHEDVLSCSDATQTNT